jgi:hypothetical protein
VGHARGCSGASVEHALGFSGGVGLWVGVMCSSPGCRLTFSENPGKILGNSRARRKILEVICRKFWDFLASFAGAPITPRERCHVTQPRARINVSCSCADHKGGTGGLGDHKKVGYKASRGWVPHQDTTPWTGRGGTGTA